MCSKNTRQDRKQSGKSYNTHTNREMLYTSFYYDKKVEIQSLNS